MFAHHPFKKLFFSGRVIPEVGRDRSFGKLPLIPCMPRENFGNVQYFRQ
jgi:hypothetical protein